MLKIQHASAGSGKTYALARKYIQSLITYKTDKGDWKLRNERQIEDAIRHILAITFTNKATNEMKQRIVNNLAILAKAKNQTVTKNLLDKTPYLEYFHNLTRAPYDNIAQNAALALKTILNNYSGFKISTIDSFFQEILRTFTYEANLTDSYQLEIDNSFVNDAALAAAMHELDSHPDQMGNAVFWIKTIMNEESKKSRMWNPFNKKNTSKSIYSKILNALAQLEKENYKDIKNILDLYFDNEKINNLTLLYKQLNELKIKERDNLLKQIMANLAVIDSLILQQNVSKSQLHSTFTSHLEIIRNLKPNQNFGKSYNRFLTDKSVFLKKYRSKENPIDIAALKMYDLLTLWDNPPVDSYTVYHLIFSPLLPYLGLILEVRSFLTNVLESNNSIQLSDTNFILKKIIGNDDAPFVYERLGNRIDNYLIDEFQDTSRMQWDIIYPLLKEGVSNKKESLIIGDPKQSIYRFRNADYKLISDVVPKLFPDHIPAGFSIEDNTNWRSHTKIVEFNNYFFKTLSEALALISLQKGASTDFKKLYSNVVQYPHNQEGKGYVEINLLSKPEISILQESDDQQEEITKDWFESAVLSRIGILITELKERGYKQNDIAILVNSNLNGKKVVEALLDYNETLSPGIPKIDFLSEESLMISSSTAVQIILSILEKFIKPDIKKEPESESENGSKTRYFNWYEIKANYMAYCKNHSDVPPALRIIDFLNNSELENVVGVIVNQLSTPAISSIVDTIIKIFIDDSLRVSDAIYLASFQDIVNEYSTSHPNDPASFLEWWKSKGNKATVASPEGNDAVQIMTIHKSKGLEFKCVIVPFATDSFTPASGKEEWRWVMPKPKEGLDLPPVLPVITSSKLEGSEFKNIYQQYFDQVLTDTLNMYYVGFTRAVNELYIFTKYEKKKNPDGINHFLDFILNGQIIPQNFNIEENLSMMSLENLFVDTEQSRISYGQEFTKLEILEEYKKEEGKKEETIKTIKHSFKEYFVNDKRPQLRSKATQVSASGEFTAS